MGWKSSLLLVLILPLSPFALATPAATPIEQFDEELTIRPLRDGKVASRFSFTTVLKGVEPRDPATLGSDDRSQHYTIFPLTLGQILREYAVTELHLTLNAGKWDYDRWGVPDEPGVGAGAELWVWMGDSAHASVDVRWQGLRNALSGLICASLGSLDDQRTTLPALSFMPEGSLPGWELPHHIRHASLPSEHVCTENLTPFLKLLPCKGLSGLARLLNPHKLFDADWHGMGVHVSWRPEVGVQVRLTFQAVSDPLRSSLGNKKRDFSFSLLFDRTIERTCPIASSSRAIVALPANESFTLQPEPTTRNESSAVFDVKTQRQPCDIGMKWPGESAFQYQVSNLEDAPLTAISVRRTLSSPNQSRGKLTVVIRNNYSAELKVIYLETMPWLVQFFLHTLEIHYDGHRRDDLISDISYTPPVPHSRPTTFQSIITLPPRSTIRLTVEVAKSFLRYTEHPPDAQRGWDLPPAVLVPAANSSRDGQSEDDHARERFPDGLPRMYTPVLLVDLATPDFSMPYNVIIFSCSLMAFIFGSIFNLMTRKFVVVRVTEEDKRE